jgi:UDP-N-acetylmuramoyl-L-alanyl-D-glutamate--2,6-diaminopimelate ligase
MTTARIKPLAALAQADVSSVPISGLVHDSRVVRPGTLFFCVPGLRQDGHDFAAEAVQRGAAALVVERPLGLGVPEVVVPSAREAMAHFAARFYDHPSAELDVIGVTGTNGKTTTAFLVRETLQAAGRRCGLLGTVKAIVAGEERGVELTTPDAIELQAALREMADGGDVAAAVEVSSHGLSLGRCEAVRFAAAIFTNLTRDHLDFHRTMEAYFHAKRRLFVADPGVAVINVDDPYGHKLADEYPDAITFALDRPASYRARDVETSIAGARLRVRTADGSFELRSPLPGRFNAHNVVGAFATARALGVDDATIVATLARAGQIPGRFELVDEGQPFAVVVDFAHTPDALDNVLATACELAQGRVICVFGCAGERDPGTRAPMGAVASARADRVIVTSDDPYTEDPAAIAAEIAGGAGPGAELVLDRAAAIARAIELADPGDVVVIAGRGHETHQITADGPRPFDDVAVARAALHGTAAEALLGGEAA